MVGTLALLWARLLSAGHAFEIFEAVPPLLIFRNPDKLGELTLEAYVVALAIGMDALWLGSVRIRRLWRVGLGGALAGIVVVVALFVVISGAHRPFDDRVVNAERFFSRGLEPGPGAGGGRDGRVPAAVRGGRRVARRSGGGGG